MLRIGPIRRFTFCRIWKPSTNHQSDPEQRVTAFWYLQLPDFVAIDSVLSHPLQPKRSPRLTKFESRSAVNTLLLSRGLQRRDVSNETSFQIAAQGETRNHFFHPKVMGRTNQLG